MEKAIDIGKSSATGTFQLLIGVAGSTVIMALGTLILGWVLTRDQLGLYGVVLIPSSMINFFRDWGVNSAMTKEIARLRAANKEADISDIIFAGVIFELTSGALLSLICAALSGILATFLQIPEASTLIAISSLSIFSGAITAGAANIFIGFEKMNYNSLTTILSAIVKTTAGPVLVILGFGVLGAIWGYTLSIVASGVIGIAIVYFALFKPIRGSKIDRRDIGDSLKPMLKYGVPLTVSNAIIGILPQIFAFTMARYAGIALMGDYYAAIYFTVLLTFLTTPIMTALFPVFAKIDPQQEPLLLKSVFESSVKYTSVLLAPATIMIMALSVPMVNTLFPNKFPNAPLFLALYVTSNLTALAGNISMGEFLTGTGASNQLMKQSLLSLMVGLPCALILVPTLGASNQHLSIIVGLAGLFASSLPGMIWGLHWIWKHYRIKPNLTSSLKLLISSSLAGLSAFLVVNFVGVQYWLQLAFGFVVFLVAYLILTPLIGGVRKDDIDNLIDMFSNMKQLSKILGIPLEFMKKLARQ